MPIMTWEEFENRTKKITRFKGRARGSNLIHVDMALQNYWDNYRRTNVGQQIELVSGLISACEKWLKKKSKKNKISELAVRRRHVVSVLANRALEELYLLNPDFLAQIHFSRSKIKTLSRNRNIGSRSLSRGYSHERTLYLQSGKTYAPSGSDLHQVHNYSVTLFGEGRHGKFARKTKQKSFEELSIQEFQKLHELGKGSGFGEQVNFLKKNTRMQFIAVPQGGLFYNIAGDRMNAPPPESRDPQYMYAIDEYGNLFTKDMNSLDPNATYFNHSSFNAGKDVISAGMIRIQNGYLLEIDNNSGHYKPNRDNLHNAIVLFEEDEVDLTYATALVYEFAGGTETIFAYRANTFLHNKHAAADMGMIGDQRELNAFLRNLPVPGI